MLNRWTAPLTVAATLCSVLIGSEQGTPPRAQTQSTPSSGAAPAPVRSGGILVPTITLGPGFTPVPDYNQVTPPEPPPQIPDGFTTLFNGKDLSGWHISKVARHGYTPEFRVVQGV